MSEQGQLSNKLFGDIAKFLVEGKKSEDSHVKAMKPWLDELDSILTKASSVSTAQRKQLALKYGQWVKSNGAFYKTVLKSNPGLAEVFKHIEDAFNIEVRIVEESVQVGASNLTEDEVPDQMAADANKVKGASEQEFTQTFLEILDKIPSNALKVRFAFQFRRWAKSNPRELSIAQQQTPILLDFIERVLDAVDPEDEEDQEEQIEKQHGDFKKNGDVDNYNAA